MTGDSVFDKYIRFVFLAWVALLPLALNPFGYQFSTLTKLAVFRLAILCAAGLWAVKSFVEGRATYRVNKLTLPVGLFFSVFVAATVVSISPITSTFGWFGRYEGLLTIFFYLLAFMIASTYFSERRHQTSLLRVFFVSAFVTAIFAILELLGLSLGIGVSGRLGSTFGNPAFYAGFLVFALGAALVLIFEPGQKDTFNWLPVTIVAFAPVFIWLSASRAAVLALVVMGLVLSVQKFGRRRLGAIGLALILILIMISAVFPNLRAAQLVKDPANNLGSRVMYWKTAAKTISRRPILGFGPDTFALVYPADRPANWTQIKRERGEVDKAHNEFLQIGVSAGLVGLAAFVWVIIIFLRRALKRQNPAPDRAFALGALGYLVWLQGYFSVVELSPYFWTFLPLAISSTSVVRVFDLRGFAKSRWRFAAAGLIAAVCVLGVARVWSEQAGDYHFGRGLALSADFQLAEINKEFAQAARQDPFESRYQLYRARALVDLGIERQDAALINKGIRVYRLILAGAPTYGAAALHLGDAFLARAELAPSRSDLRKAVKTYRQAGQALKNSPAVESRLGRAYLALGEKKQAAGHWRAALALDQGDPKLYDDLIKLYRREPSLGDYREIKAKKAKFAVDNIGAAT